MTKYPNRDALRQANDIYLDCMRSFVVHHLKQVPGEEIGNLIAASLNDEQIDMFWRKLDEHDDIESAIDFNYFPPIIKENWLLKQYRRDYGFAQRFNADMTVQNRLWLIKEGRNSCEHRPAKDLDSEFVRTHLFLIAEVLSKINRSDKQREVEDIRDQLFSHISHNKERIADLVNQIDETRKEKTGLEIQLEDMSNRLNTKEAENDELEKRLETISGRLKDVEREKAAYKKRIETIPDQLEDANAEKIKYGKALKATSNQLATLKTVNAQLEERLEITSAQLEEVEAELADCKEDLSRALSEFEIEEVEETEYEEDLVEMDEHLSPNTDIPDSITFHGTTFTECLNEYHVTGDDISQGFWYYWQSLGREGKQEMRDAGWSVEKVNGEWEVTVSPEDFRAWIKDEVTELNSLLDLSRNEELSTQSIQPSYERTSLPTVKEMVQPALELFADRKEHRRVEMINILTEHFSLDDDERRYISKTGQVEKHLMSEGLIERTRKGYYRITDLGLEVLR